MRAPWRALWATGASREAPGGGGRGGRAERRGHGRPTGCHVDPAHIPADRAPRRRAAHSQRLAAGQMLPAPIRSSGFLPGLQPGTAVLQDLLPGPRPASPTHLGAALFRHLCAEQIKGSAPPRLRRRSWWARGGTACPVCGEPQVYQVWPSLARARREALRMPVAGLSGATLGDSAMNLRYSSIGFHSSWRAM